MDKKVIDEVTRLDNQAQRILSDTEFSSQKEFNYRRARKIYRALEYLDLVDSLKDGGDVLELGPGHYGFALLARALGSNVSCFERDLAFVRLGRYLGFEVFDGDFYSELRARIAGRKFDGLWVKGTFNACRMQSDEEVESFSIQLDSTLKDGGWGVLVPVNRAETGQQLDTVARRIEVQKESMLGLGWCAVEIGEDARRSFSFFYSGSPSIFLKNTEI